MAEVLTVAIGIGLAVSLLFTELFGLAAGGMVVPGYVALYLNEPLSILLTLFVAVATYFVVHLLSTFVIIYGRRRTVSMILVGYIIRILMDFIPLGSFGTIDRIAGEESSLAVIGFIIPGLIAIWIDRQGLVETLTALLAASVAIRLILIMIYGVDLELVSL